MNKANGNDQTEGEERSFKNGFTLIELLVVSPLQGRHTANRWRDLWFLVNESVSSPLTRISSPCIAVEAENVWYQPVSCNNWWNRFFGPGAASPASQHGSWELGRARASASPWARHRSGLDRHGADCLRGHRDADHFRRWFKAGLFPLAH